MTMESTPLTLEEFKQILVHNPGMVILKFGATWCGPCKRCEPTVHSWFDKLQEYPTIQTLVIDVDESFELYAFLKNKKMVQGIPALLMYQQHNLHYTFDDSCNTSDVLQINAFFHRCLDKMTESA